MRFAFYGRVSTEDQQDPDASRNWQLTRARALVERHGEMVVEFFDVGQSRSIPWKRRPQAALLLDAFKNPDRGFDAVVIGEPSTRNPKPTTSSCRSSQACPRGNATGSKSECARRWPPRPRWRAGFSVADRPTGTDWSMPGHIPTRPKLLMANASIGSNPIQPPHRSCSASTPSTPQGGDCSPSPKP